MELLQLLQDSWIATELRRPGIAYPLLNTAHILSLALVVGSIAVLDLRLLGAFRLYAVDQLAPPLMRTASIALIFAIATGFLLFSVRPTNYIQNPAFLLKVAFVALGATHALSVRCTPYWRRAMAGGPKTASVKLSAFLSLAIWTGAVLCGRWIAFVD